MKQSKTINQKKRMVKKSKKLKDKGNNQNLIK